MNVENFSESPHLSMGLSPFKARPTVLKDIQNCKAHLYIVSMYLVSLIIMLVLLHLVSFMPDARIYLTSKIIVFKVLTKYTIRCIDIANTL